MPDRREIRCATCGLVDVIEAGDVPGEMGIDTYAAFVADNHEADCLRADVRVEEAVAVTVQTTKYDTGGGLDGD